MRSLFLRTFLGFWLTVLLAGVALLLSVQWGTTKAINQREEIFSKLLPVEAARGAESFERSGTGELGRHFEELQTRYPVQVFLYADGEREVLGRPAPNGVRDLALLTAMHGRLYVVGNLASDRTVSPSGRTYVMVMLQEPSDQFRRENRTEVKRWVAYELPAVILLAAGLFCYATARYVTKPILGLRAAAAGISEGRLETRVDPEWKERSDEIGALSRDFDLMAGRIEALVAGQKRLLGDVSHELRSPLSRLMLALSLLKKRPQAEAAELIDRIGIETRRLDKLIDQLLTLARIDSGMHAGSQRFDLANLVEEVARDAGFEARAGGRDVAVTSINGCSMSGSEELVRSAIENVVRNAVRYTREGSSVEISLEQHGGRALLRVRDHGPGVPEQMLSQIFAPFRRIHSEEPNGNGAGLGLAITERAVRLHGGNVRAANAQDGGLIVEIELPEKPGG